MEQCRDGRSSVPKAAAADADGGSLQPSKSTAGATSSGADDAAAAAVDVEEKQEEMLALIGQELVPVVNSQKGDEKSEEESKKKKDSERFQTPSAAKPPESPEQLQLQNSPHVKQNDDEIQKGESEEKGQMMVTPNGPPTMYGPVSVSPLPLFTPEQVAQMNDPRASTSLLPLTRESVASGEPHRLHALFQGLLPGFEQLQGLQEARQREAEWRAGMEATMEQLGLQLRVSQSENMRLRKELQDVKDMSRYGTPEEKSSSGRDGELGHGHGGVSNRKEDGAVARQEHVGLKLKRKPPPKEGGARARQVLSEEEGTAVRQALSSKEDGVVTQQGDFKDRWTKVTSQLQEGSSEEEDQSDQGDETKEDGSRDQQGSSKHPKSTDAQTIQVLLKIVEGMQAMQQKFVDGKEEQKDEVEYVRFSQELPRLQEWSSETAPIDFGDWIICLHTYMSDLSSTSESWWDLTLQVAKDWYDEHMKLNPIQRLTHSPNLPQELRCKKWSRLERRAASMLMSALPESLKEEVISSKSLTAIGILTKAMVQYQPGGLSERSAILSALEAPSEASTINAAITQLRRWCRWKRRAEEVGVSVPDPTILIRGLGRLMRKITVAYPELSFRLSLVRNSLLVDTIPTLQTVTQYSEHLLAELEQMGHQAKRREVQSEPQLKVKKLEENHKAEDFKAGFKAKEDGEMKKKPCRFFLTDSGCRRGKRCQFGHVLDGERRCWTCGAKDHLAPNCPRMEDSKPKAAKIVPKIDKDAKSVASSSEKMDESGEKPEVEGEESMKNLLDEANKMLKSLQETEVREKRQIKEDPSSKIQGLQKQLDELKKAALRPFRISKICSVGHGGLLDSGATHPLRPRRKGERISHFPKVNVTLAGDKQVTMCLSPTGIIIGDEDAEPIVPMGVLATSLGCSITWSGADLEVWHPQHGSLQVQLKDGCPMISYELALKLIQEIEEKASLALKAMQLSDGQGGEELSWLKRLVNEHPVFAQLPEHLREALVEVPAESLIPLANRRTRKLWKKKGVLIHAFSGQRDGYTLKRAFHEVGGDKRLMCELDVLHGTSESDLGPTGTGYALLLRLALDGYAKGWLGGPPCRTRSMLRHQAIEGKDMPRPLRSWDGEEFGLRDLSSFEKNQVFTDDVLMLRFLLLYVVSEEIRKVNGIESPTTLLLEQPADLPHMPEVVTIWRTPFWKKLQELYKLQTQTFNQSEFAATATKPTTTGGTLSLMVPMPGRRGVPRSVEGKTKMEVCEESKALARWPPLLMRSIAQALQTGPMGGTIKMRALSWKEHVAAGHTPFRKDCLVCQRAAAKDHHHRRSKLPPRVGVLSLDLSGPFRVAPDIGGVHPGTAKYLLVGAFTWLAKDQLGEDFEDLEVPKVPEGAPEIDDAEGDAEDIEEAPLPALRDDEDVWGERQAERDAVQAEVHAEDQQPEKDEEQKEEERVEPKITVTRLCTPIKSKSQQDVLRAIIDMYLRLRSDGYVVSQIHSDRGGEFMHEALAKWCASRTILHTFTPGDQPQSNGRVEVSVQWIKSEIRRVLHCRSSLLKVAACGPKCERKFEATPGGKHYACAQLSCSSFGEEAILEGSGTFAHTGTGDIPVSILGPPWSLDRARRWILDDYTRMVMHQLTDPPRDENWIGLEDQLAPVEARRRIRGKISLNHLAYAAAFPDGGEHGDSAVLEEENEKEEEVLRMRKVIEEEMKHAVEDDRVGAYLTVDAVSSLKQVTIDSTAEEVLQTRVVSQCEVRKNLPDWIQPIQNELNALFQTKKALKPIDAKLVQQLVSSGKAEILPSKMVWTVKPSPGEKGGKRKARLVACGNFAERSESDLFAGGATAVALRAALSIASQQAWSGRVSDIKTAFLNAPMKLGGSTDLETGEVTEEMIAVIKPPPILVLAGLAKPDEFWQVVMALYGYKESPRLWANHRDDVIQKMEIPMDDGSFLTLDQMVTEPNMWRVIKHEPGPFLETKAEQLCGLLLVYVDDLLLLGPPMVLDSMMASIQAIWETSPPEEIDEVAGVRFLGAELYRDGSRWWMTQQNYLMDLLNRNLGPPPWMKRKIPMSMDPEARQDPPNHNLETTREAQRVVGELVWVSTRTRPDLSFSIAKLASLITRDPQRVLDVVPEVWQYLANTIDQGLEFRNSPDETQLNIYTDASFGETCMGCHLVMWGDSMLLWKSGKQSVVTASTAESELVEILEGAIAGDAVRVVLEEILDLRARAVSFTDNTAAIAIITGESGSWRTRHLRKRAQVLRTKVALGDWLLRHLAGQQLPADQGTKVLGSEKFKTFKMLMGMYMGKGEEFENGNDGKGGGCQKSDKAKQALRAIILFAKLAMAKGQDADQLQLWQPVLPLRAFSDPSSGPPFFLILIMVFGFGLIFGAALMWALVYPYFQKVTLVESMTNVVPRPSFLFHALPETSRMSRESTNEAPLPRRRSAASSSPAADRTTGASAAGGAAGAVATRSSPAAARTTGAAAAGGAGGAAGAAGSSAADSSSAPADAAAADRSNQGAAERGNLGSRARRRQAGARSRALPLYITEMGQRFHCDTGCHGLRNARTVHEVSRCQICGPEETRPTEALYGLGVGHSLHASLQHLQNLSEGGEIKRYAPCAICIFAD